MSKLATIERIHSIQPHPNPEVEKLEIGKIKAWPVVIEKGKYKEGELVVFITIDSIVPNSDYFKFMERQKFRVWNARFKGAPSQGLVCPLSAFNLRSDNSDPHFQVNEGDDVTEIIGVVKYERPIDIQIGGDAKGGFPTNYISISDELNLLSYPEALTELEGRQVYATLKADGSSTTFIHNNGEFKACSRRLEMQEGSGFPYRAADKYDLKSKILLYAHNIAIQAECVGPKLNGNRMGLKEIELRIYRAKWLDSGMLFNYYELQDLCKKLEVPMVKEICNFTFDSKIHTIDFFQNLANEQKWDTNNEPAEGIVLTPKSPFYSNILGKFWSLKLININYK